MKLTLRLPKCLVLAAVFAGAIEAGLGAQAVDPFTENVRSTPWQSPEQELKTFHLPPGFEIQLFASEPDIAKPMNMAFDERGRLWLTDTVEYPFPAPKDRKGRDTVKILEDTDGDGQADKITTFADDLSIPIGIYPYKNGAIVWSIPSILHLEDTDGDGKSDQRNVLYGPVKVQDTHGMQNAFRRGFDGWLYINHGYSNESTFRGKDRSSITMQSGNTYRVRLDGSHVEQVTWGQVNPFGSCYDAFGFRYTADCHSLPIYQLIPEAYYPSFGKPDDGLGFGPEIMRHSHGSTALSGLVYCWNQDWPEEFHDNMLVGNVVTCRINRDQLIFSGSSPTAHEMPDFLSTDDPWFRPVDLQMGPDGALYVADFYNRIIGHYEVPLDHPGRDRESGRIWRIVYRGDSPREERPERFDLTRATLAGVISETGSPNLTRRMLAMNYLVDHYEKKIVPLLTVFLKSGNANTFQRAHGLWILERLAGLDEDLLQSAVADSEAIVRTHAIRILAERAEWKAGEREMVVHGLNDPNANVRRVAGLALAKHPAPSDLRPLLDALRETPDSDTHLKHQLRIALRDQFRFQKGKLYQQLPLADWTDQDARAVADVSPGVHNAASAAWLVKHIQNVEEPKERLAEYLRYAAGNLNPSGIKELAGFVRAKFQEDVDFQLNLFQAIESGGKQQGSRMTEDFRQWGAELAGKFFQMLEDATAESNAEAKRIEELRKNAVQLTLDLKLSDYAPRLKEIALQSGADPEIRASAIEALAETDTASAIEIVRGYSSDPSADPQLQQAMIASLGKSKRRDATDALLEMLETTPSRLQEAIAECLAGSRSNADQLLRKIEAGKASPRLLTSRSIQEKLRAAQPRQWRQRLATLTKGLPEETDARIDLINERIGQFDLASASPENGKQVFTQVCAVCHRIQGEGGMVGPQLDGIGKRGLERVAEDILDPNRNVDQAFRYTLVTTKDDEVLQGLFRREEGETLVFANTAGNEFSIPKDNIAEQTKTESSLMPDNLGEALPQQQFNDLLAFLLADGKTN